MRDLIFCLSIIKSLNCIFQIQIQDLERDPLPAMKIK